MGDTEDESIFKTYYNMWFDTKQPATHKVEKRTRYSFINLSSIECKYKVSVLQYNFFVELPGGKW